MFEKVEYRKNRYFVYDGTDKYKFVGWLLHNEIKWEFAFDATCQVPTLNQYELLSIVEKLKELNGE
jgi:hypothetical protein